MNPLQESFLKANGFSEHDLQEIKFALLYSQDFQHGTDGPNRLPIIARFSQLLEGLESWRQRQEPLA